MELKKQDKNGVRTAVDLQRRINYEETERKLLELETKTELDTELSSSSSLGVENRVVTKAINDVTTELNKKIDSNEIVFMTNSEIDELFEEGGNDG